MKDKILFILLSFTFTLLLSNFSCGQPKEPIEITGTIKYYSFEGGFYGLAGDDGKNYEPMNLDKSYYKDYLKVKVKGIIRDDIMSSKNWGTILEIKDIEIITAPVNAADYEIHEWGVMVGCTNEETHFITSRPEITYDVKQPVIYVHSNDKTPFSAKVTFKNGKPTSVYPETIIEDNTTEWNDVTFEQAKKGLKEAIDTSRFYPLKSIMEQLNNVDADRLLFNNTSSMFLFYEGEMDFSNKVEVRYEPASGEVIFVNNFPYTVNNVVFSTSEGNFLNPVYLSCQVGELKAGESKTVKVSNPEAGYWTQDLISLGFTEMESKSFSQLWQKPFLASSNAGGWKNLIYRIPQEELEKMITLEFNPIPKKIIRVLYVLIHL